MAAEPFNQAIFDSAVFGATAANKSTPPFQVHRLVIWRRRQL